MRTCSKPRITRVARSRGGPAAVDWFSSSRIEPPGEVHYAETPLFDDLVGGALPRALGGEISLPKAPGLGVRLDSALALALANQVGNTQC